MFLVEKTSAMVASSFHGGVAMKLIKLKVKNFRGYRNEVTVSFDDFCAIVGRNDVGKSTLLEALEIFFNHQLVKMDQADSCVHGDGRVVEIACVFEELPQSLIIDARSETTLAAEWLLNTDGHLEVVKRFDCRTKSPKEEVFARAHTSSHAQLSDLLKLKNAELKVRARDVGCDLEDVDERSNTALRGAIRRTVGAVEMGLQLVPLSEEDGKKAWDQIEKSMPTFALFQADRPSKDDDPEVADPMKLAIANAVAEVAADLEAIKAKVQASVLEVAARTLSKLHELDPALAQELTPAFKSEPNWGGFKLTLAGDDQIPINKRGSGVRRLILLSFFRAEAERRRSASGGKRVIYAIEEPESSQHPDNQVLLIRTLLALSDDPRTQVILTTHVPAVAALVPTQAVRLVRKGPDGAPQVEEGTDDVYRQVVEALGVLPDKRAQVAVYVEGPNDVEFLRHACRLHRAVDATIIDFETDHRVAFVPTGGGNLQHWVDQQYLANAGLTEVHIYDTDDQTAPKYAAQINMVNGRGSRDIGFLTSKRELENYIHSDAIHAEYGFNIVVDDWCDVPALVAEQVHIAGGGAGAWALVDDAKKGKKASNAKRRLNAGVMSRMTLQQLQARDAGADIVTWLHAIRDRVE